MTQQMPTIVTEFESPEVLKKRDGHGLRDSADGEADADRPSLVMPEGTPNTPFFKSQHSIHQDFLSEVDAADKALKLSPLKTFEPIDEELPE